MSVINPFSSRFEVFGRESRHLVMEVNGEAFGKLLRLLNSKSGMDGRVILLKAPRAGYGKTFLLQRVAEAMGHEPQFVKVTLRGGRTIDASHVLDFVLQSLCRVLPASGGLTDLDLLARRILARGLEPLVGSGEVPCQDRDGALAALRKQPVETFDFHHESAVTAHWTETNFEILGPRLASELSGVSGASLRESAYWVELMFRFATTSPENVERSRLLYETVFRSDVRLPSESTAGERLHGLLALLGIVTQVIMVVDDTEGLSTHPPDALELASFLTNLVHSCPGMVVILSVNNDVWDTAFAPRLPGGLADRLTENEVSLGPLTHQQAEELIRVRAGALAGDVLDRIDLESGQLFARDVLKSASEVWESLEHDEVALAAGLPGGERDHLRGGLGTLTGMAAVSAITEEGDFAGAATGSGVVEPEDSVFLPEGTEEEAAKETSEEIVLESEEPPPVLVDEVTNPTAGWADDEDVFAKSLDGEDDEEDPAFEASALEEPAGEEQVEIPDPFAAVPPPIESPFAAAASEVPQEDEQPVEEPAAEEKTEMPDPFAAVPPPIESLFASAPEAPLEDEKPVEEPVAEEKIETPNPFAAVPPPITSPFAASASEAPLEDEKPVEEPVAEEKTEMPDPFAAAPPPIESPFASAPEAPLADEKPVEEPVAEEKIETPNPFAAVPPPITSPFAASAPEAPLEDEKPVEEPVAEEKIETPNPFAAVPPPITSPFAASAPEAPLADEKPVEEPVAEEKIETPNPFAAVPPPITSPFAASAPEAPLEDEKPVEEPVAEEKIETPNPFAAVPPPIESPFGGADSMAAEITPEPAAEVTPRPFAVSPPDTGEPETIQIDRWEDDAPAQDETAGEPEMAPNPFAAVPEPAPAPHAVVTEKTHQEPAPPVGSGPPAIPNPFSPAPPSVAPPSATAEDPRKDESAKPAAPEPAGSPNPFAAVPPAATSPLAPGEAEDPPAEQTREESVPPAVHTRSSNPFAAAAPPARSPFAPVEETGDEERASGRSANEPAAIPNPFAAVPPPVASPFAPAPEQGSESVAPASIPSSPFAPAAPTPEPAQEANPVTPAAQVPSPFAPVQPSPFSPVDDGAAPGTPSPQQPKVVLPPKRISPADPAPSTSISSPFEKATAPVYVTAPPTEPVRPTPATPVDVPPPSPPVQSTPATPSPFAPAPPSPFAPGPESGGPQTSGTFRGGQGAPSGGDEAKVDELLRQFKERYGRE